MRCALRRNHFHRRSTGPGLVAAEVNADTIAAATGNFHNTCLENRWWVSTAGAYPVKPAARLILLAMTVEILADAPAALSDQGRAALCFRLRR